MITLDAIPSDLSLDRMRMGQSVSTTSSSSTHATETLLLTVGTENGTVLRVEVDERTGKLGTARSPRLLGPRPIRLFKVVVEGQRCVLALSLKPWLCYCAGNTMMLTPLVCESMDFAACFNTPQCTDGLVMLRSADLQILRVDSLSQPFAAASMPLSYTPRQLAATPGPPA